VTPDNTPVEHPFTLHANAAVAQALEILRRTLDEETSRSVEDAAAVRAAIRRHFAPEREPKGTLRASIDLVGNVSADDEPSASAVWLPLYEALDRNDSRSRRTV
jgi:hypothetical protein